MGTGRMTDTEDNWRDHTFAEMSGYPVDITLSCGCTKVSNGPPAYFLSRLGVNATPRDAAARMICHVCQQRPRLSISRSWSVGDPPELPDWMGLGDEKTVPLLRTD